MYTIFIECEVNYIHFGIPKKKCIPREKHRFPNQLQLTIKLNDYGAALHVMLLINYKVCILYRLPWWWLIIVLHSILNTVLWEESNVIIGGHELQI